MRRKVVSYWRGEGRKGKKALTIVWEPWLDVAIIEYQSNAFL